MKRFKNFMLAAGLSTLLGSAVLQGQENGLSANIPFAFHASGKVLPAGTYIFTKNIGPSGIFEVRNRADKNSLFVSAPVPAHYKPNESKLVFLQTGGEYVLTEIYMAGRATTNAVMPETIEKSLPRKLGVVSMIAVPLHR